MTYNLEDLLDTANPAEVLAAIDSPPDGWQVKLERRNNQDLRYRYIATVSTGLGDDFRCQYAFGSCPAAALREAAIAFLSEPIASDPVDPPARSSEHTTRADGYSTEAT